MAMKKGLGKGLDALLGEYGEAVHSGVKEIDVYAIDTNAAQPRKDFDEEKLKELASSIERHGILQPIVVRENGARYSIVMGERRFRAARMCGLQKVPVIVRSLEDAQAMEAALVENLQREDLNPVEEAAGIRHLMEQQDLTQEEAAERLGKSRPAVANALRLLSLPPAVQAMLRTGALQAGHARALVAMKDGEKQAALAARIVEEGLSVREVEALVREAAEAKEAKAKKKAAPSRSAELGAAEKALRERLGTKVEISGSEKRGKIVISYYNAAELESLYGLLLGADAERG